MISIDIREKGNRVAKPIRQSMLYHYPITFNMDRVKVPSNQGSPAGIFDMQDYQFFLLVGLIVWALGLYKLIQAYYYYQQFKKAQQDWHETLGTVTERKINQKVPSQTRQVPFWVEIKYSYTVIGSKINGLMVKRPYLFSTDALEKIFKEFPPGKRFMIHYNPEKPTMHITEFDRFLFDWAQVGFAFLWGTVLLYIGFKIPH